MTIINNRYAAGTVLALVALASLAWLWGRRSRNPVSARTCRYLVLAAMLMIIAVGVVEVLDRLGVDARSRYDNVFTVAVACMVAWLGFRLFREEPPAAERLFLLIAVVFLAVVAFGPGYGAHYAPWFLPALIATYVLLDDNWRWLLRIGYVVAAVTYAVEYAFVSFLGAYAAAMFGSSQWMVDFGDYLSNPHRWVLFRVPLFVVYLVVIAAGIARLTEQKRSEPVVERLDVG